MAASSNPIDKVVPTTTANPVGSSSSTTGKVVELVQPVLNSTTTSGPTNAPLPENVTEKKDSPVTIAFTPNTSTAANEQNATVTPTVTINPFADAAEEKKPTENQNAPAPANTGAPEPKIEVVVGNEEKEKTQEPRNSPRDRTLREEEAEGVKEENDLPENTPRRRRTKEEKGKEIEKEKDEDGTEKSFNPSRRVHRMDTRRLHRRNYSEKKEKSKFDIYTIAAIIFFIIGILICGFGLSLVTGAAPIPAFEVIGTLGKSGIAAVGGVFAVASGMFIITRLSSE